MKIITRGLKLPKKQENADFKHYATPAGEYPTDENILKGQKDINNPRLLRGKDEPIKHG